VDPGFPLERLFDRRFGQVDVVRIVSVEIFFWEVVRVVRAEILDAQVERCLRRIVRVLLHPVEPPFREEVGEGGFDRSVIDGTALVSVAAVRERVAEVLNAHVWEVALVEILFIYRVVVGVVPARVVLPDHTERRGRLADVRLPDVADVVAGVAESLRITGPVVSERSALVDVASQAVSMRAHPRENRSTGRRTDCGRRVRAVESCSVGGESIERRSLDPAVSVRPDAVDSLLVRHHEEDVRPATGFRRQIGHR
jgi:hypothetical protein